ncbi:hypothetical protein B296_00027000 [Ensete ventricosum]|uniref:Uncharacterized protein n=1 Tax=Ensete ventricosum TaxID=4639 RepID=A0A427A223_ENSVE|nr:hypothetical protein B296_00027000 [Ensete ventricosum]
MASSSSRCMVVVVALCLLVLVDVSVAAESAINCNLGTDGCYEACRAKGHWEVTCFACNYFCPAVSTGFIGGGGSLSLSLSIDLSVDLSTVLYAAKSSVFVAGRAGTRAPSPTADNN